jgi:hypothetical protein
MEEIIREAKMVNLKLCNLAAAWILNYDKYHTYAGGNGTNK